MSLVALTKVGVSVPLPTTLSYEESFFQLISKLCYKVTNEDKTHANSLRFDRLKSALRVQSQSTAEITTRVELRKYSSVGLLHGERITV